MMPTNDLWEALGEVEEDDVPHVLTKLFIIYEEQLSRKPDDEATQLFFKRLRQALEQVNGCNLNRR
ncbi:MAG: hypothetical protein K9K37_01675 [Desulfocapsa sp.]|nr:hypothetical protein [Desulfocapsa sp.]